LVLEHLDHHPEANKSEYQEQVRRLKNRVPEALRTLELLRPRLKDRYEAYEQARQARRAQRKPVTSEDLTSLPEGSSSFTAHRPRRRSPPQPLDLAMHQKLSSTPISSGPFSPERSQSPASARGIDLDSSNLALEIARQEFEKRERAKRDRRRQAAIEAGRNVPLDSAGAEIRRISTPTLPGAGYKDLRQLYNGPSSAGHINSSFREELEEERRLREAEEDERDLLRSIQALDMSTQQSESRPQSQPQSQRYSDTRRQTYYHHDLQDSLSAYDFQGFPDVPIHKDKLSSEKHVGKWHGSYPTVPKRQHSPSDLISTPPLPYSSSGSTRTATPTPQPKKPMHTSFLMDGPPALPPKVPDYAPLTPPIPPAVLSPLSPPKKKEAAKNFSTPAALENGIPLRTMFLPRSLRQTFLDIVDHNTSRDLETCGILCGTLTQNALFVSRLVIPEQEATANTCTTKDEEALFEYCDKEDLMVLGWIHTHPSQTCFMSSVDLHTHVGYQLMLPESIAIVCAPSKIPS
jgi:STAM-binding protein